MHSLSGGTLTFLSLFVILFGGSFDVQRQLASLYVRYKRRNACIFALRVQPSAQHARSLTSIHSWLVAAAGVAQAPVAGCDDCQEGLPRGPQEDAKVSFTYHAALDKRPIKLVKARLSVCFENSRRLVHPPRSPTKGAK